MFGEDEGGKRTVVIIKGCKQGGERLLALLS